MPGPGECGRPSPYADSVEAYPLCPRALDLAPDVRVNAVAPGPVGTEKLHAELSSAVYGGFEDAGDGVAALTGTLPIGRLVEPDEIARAVYFLAGMPAMTGAVLSVDGGTSIALP